MASSPLIDAALRRAENDRTRLEIAPSDGRKRQKRYAIGDPQAPFEKMLAILDRDHLLAGDGHLAPDVALISLGDHFDWGGHQDRNRATRDGLTCLAWLAAHPSDQVTIVFGNHDLARVGELATFDDASFLAARAEADLAYRKGDVDPALEKQLMERWPAVPYAEVIARDNSTFAVEQRAFVERLLRERRAKLAHAAAPDLLFVHAGVTNDDLGAIGLHTNDAHEIANAVAAFVDARVRAWDGKAALDLAPLHVAGSAAYGEGRGITHHRPSHPDASEKAAFQGPPSRRFDPRAIPIGLTQVIGHIRDSKTRRLLGPWADGEAPKLGVLRTLQTNGVDIRYRHGVHARAIDEGAIIFADGGMLDAPIEEYELFTF